MQYPLSTLLVTAVAMYPCAADDALVQATWAVASSKTPDEQHYLDKTAMAQRLQLTGDAHAWGSCADICSSRSGTLATVRNAAEQEAVEEFLEGTGAYPWVGLHKNASGSAAWSWIGSTGDENQRPRSCESSSCAFCPDIAALHNHI